MSEYSITHLRELEAEAIYVIREVAAQFEKPALLFSGGKDSIVMYYLALKAFYPQVVPFPWDTTLPIVQQYHAALKPPSPILKCKHLV